MSGVFADAPCVGKSWLFDSVEAVDHRQAAAMCRTCPALVPCEDLLRQERTVARTIAMGGGGPRGTWAGHLVGKPRANTNTWEAVV